MNPFDFAPIPPDGPKPLPEEVGKGRCVEGYLEYSIETKTPLHITGLTTKTGNHFGVKTFYENYGRKIIPGASVRGMLAAFIEALTGSDMSIFTRGDENENKPDKIPPYAKYYNSKDKDTKPNRHVGFLVASRDHNLASKKNVIPGRTKLKYERAQTLPDGFGQGKTKDAARFLFGFINPETDADGNDPTSRAGRLIFEDIIIEDDNVFDKWNAWDIDGKAIMGGPNPRANTAWYFEPGEPRWRFAGKQYPVWEILANKIRGRKFYFHQYPKKCHDEYRGWAKFNEDMRRAEFKKNGKSKTPKMVEYQVDALRPGTIIPGGRIYFTDMPERLLKFLIYWMELENNMAFKLGALKPFGFGSVSMKVTGVFYREMDAPLDPIKPRPIEKGAFDSELIYRPAYEKLNKIMHFPTEKQKEDYVFVYPVYRQQLKNPKDKGFAQPETAPDNQPKLNEIKKFAPTPGNSKKITMYFDHYQKNARNYPTVMEQE
jgi:hypothetical protein